jgi:hypothetical protein
MIVDFDGRVLAQADPGPVEKIIVGPIDVGALRDERQRRRGHHMLSQQRVESYGSYQHPLYPGGQRSEPLTIEANEEAIRIAQKRLRERWESFR